jgi:hypothetical protein
MSIRTNLVVLITVASIALIGGCDEHGHSHDEKPAAKAPSTQPTPSEADGHSHGPNGEHN